MMKEHLPVALEVVLAVIGILGALAGAAGYFNANYAKSRIAALNGDLEEQDRRYDVLKEECEDLKKRLVQETEARRISDNKVRVLEEVVTGKSELEQIAEILRVHEERARSIETTLNEILRLQKDGQRRRD